MNWIHLRLMNHRMFKVLCIETWTKFTFVWWSERNSLVVFKQNRNWMLDYCNDLKIEILNANGRIWQTMHDIDCEIQLKYLMLMTDFERPLNFETSKSKYVLQGIQTSQTLRTQPILGSLSINSNTTLIYSNEYKRSGPRLPDRNTCLKELSNVENKCTTTKCQLNAFETPLVSCLRWLKQMAACKNSYKILNHGQWLTKTIGN